METAPASTRAPLLWGLLPLMAGLVLEGIFPDALGLPTLLGLAALCALMGFFSKHPYLRRTAFVAGGLFIAMLYGGLRIPQAPEEAKLPPRETELSLKITKLYLRDDAPTRYVGLGTVTAAPTYVDYLKGARVAFTLRGEANAAQVGEIWRARGIAEALPKDAAAFSYANTLSHTGRHFRLYQGRLLNRESQAGLTSRWIDTMQTHLAGILERSTPESARGIYAAMLLGKKGSLEAHTKQAFVQSGTFHLFAISGLHIGVIAGALFFVLRWMRIPSLPAAMLGLTLLLIYVVITGASASAMRAFLMAACLWGAHIVLRRPAPFAALVVSAFMVLLVSPAQLWEPGFQLSYSVVAGILLYGLPLAKMLKDKLNTLGRYIPESSLSKKRRAAAWFLDRSLESIAITWSATLYSLPLIVAYFHIVSPGGILLNLVLVPLASLVIVLGFFSIFFGLFWLTWISATLNTLASYVIAGLQGLTFGMLKLHGLFWEAAPRGPTWAWLGLLALLLILLINRTHGGKRPQYHYWAPPLAACLWVAIATAPQSWVAL